MLRSNNVFQPLSVANVYAGKSSWLKDVMKDTSDQDHVSFRTQRAEFSVSAQLGVNKQMWLTCIGGVRREIMFDVHASDAKQARWNTQKE